ncbi:hypothetical protein Tco_1298911, partial [Tanacetum coccineum]
MVHAHLLVNAQGCNGGCWLLRRLSHRLQAAVKAATKFAGCYEGCQISCMLLRRLQRSLLAHAKAAILLRRLKRSSLALAKACIEIVGCCEGYNGAYWLLWSYNEAYWLLRRLLQRVQAAVKAVIYVVGCCEGCHIAKKAATLIRRLQRFDGDWRIIWWWCRVQDNLHIRNRRHYVDGAQGKPSGAASGVRISHGDYDIEVIPNMYEAVMEVEMLRPKGFKLVKGPWRWRGPSRRRGLRGEGGLRGEHGLRGEGGSPRR